jgi:hypothetical protein
MVRVHFRRVPLQPSTLSLWLVLGKRRPPALIGFLRHDDASGQWAARPRADGMPPEINFFPDRRTAAEALLLDLCGFARGGGGVNALEIPRSAVRR